MWACSSAGRAPALQESRQNHTSAASGVANADSRGAINLLNWTEAGPKIALCNDSVNSRGGQKSKCRVWCRLHKTRSHSCFSGCTQSCTHASPRENIAFAANSKPGSGTHSGEHLLCKRVRALQRLHPLLDVFNVFNKFRESASRSK
jgi:hypothetical protein